MRKHTSWSWNEDRELTIIQRITNPEDPYYMDSFQQVTLPLHEVSKLIDELLPKLEEFELTAHNIVTNIFEGVAPGGSV